MQKITPGLCRVKAKGQHFEQLLKFVLPYFNACNDSKFLMREKLLKKLLKMYRLALFNFNVVVVNAMHTRVT